MTINQIRRMITQLKSDDGKIDLGEAKRLVAKIKKGGVQSQEISGLQRIAQGTLTRPAGRYIDSFVDGLERAARR